MTRREELVAEEQRIDQLRLAAFKTNSGQDRQTYFDAVSKWFQDRHYRRLDRQEASVTVPRVTDNDRDEITVTLEGKELRWSYASDQERRTKMLCAREFVEGFCTGRQS